MVNHNSTPHASGNAANQAGSFSLPMKPALSFSSQLDIMESRGLVVEDRSLALTRLSQTNYYRLRGYWLTYERDGTFIPGTTFETVWDTYELDRELRQIVWAAIEPIEIKARTSFAYHLSLACGPDAYENGDLFKSKKGHSKSIANFKRERDRAIGDGVPCVRHNMEKYGALPAWAAVEIMTMGTVSQLYGNLSNKAAYSGRRTVKAAVAEDFGTKPYYLKSWLRHLTYVRNICGHHSRLYNRVMTTRGKLLSMDSAFDGPKQFPTLMILKRMYERSWPEEWGPAVSDLRSAFDKHGAVSLKPMGFPKNWTDTLLE